MKKTLYSLMLTDDIVREIDIIAHRSGTNRSNLINQILAEYVNYTTPERRINDIFSAVEELMRPCRDIVPFFAPNMTTMSLKSSLQYKYRPTVKYEVELYGAGGGLGELAVVFRTQSAALIEVMGGFFRLWKGIEEKYLPKVMTGEDTISYALYDGRFTRSLAVPHGKEYSPRELARLISRYIRLFDTCLKGYVSGQLRGQEVEEAYIAYLKEGDILI